MSSLSNVYYVPFDKLKENTRQQLNDYMSKNNTNIMYNDKYSYIYFKNEPFGDFVRIIPMDILKQQNYTKEESIGLFKKISQDTKMLITCLFIDKDKIYVRIPLKNGKVKVFFPPNSKHIHPASVFLTRTKYVKYSPSFKFDKDNPHKSLFKAMEYMKTYKIFIRDIFSKEGYEW